MANDPNRSHEHKHPEPPAASTPSGPTIPGDAIEGSSPGRTEQERKALLTERETDEEAEYWDRKKEPR